MPVYIAKFDSCDCTPVPDMAFRADDMVSAVMQCREKLDVFRAKAAEAHIELHGDITIEAIEEVGFELMDEVGIEGVVEFWKDVVVK